MTTLQTIDRVTLTAEHRPAACDDCGIPIELCAEVFETSRGAVYCSWECVTGKDRRRNPEDYTTPDEPGEFVANITQAIRDAGGRVSRRQARTIPDDGDDIAPGQQLGLLGRATRGGLTGSQMTFGFQEPARYERDAERAPIQDDPQQTRFA